MENKTSIHTFVALVGPNNASSSRSFVVMIVIAIAAAFVSSLVDASPIKDALFASHRWRASSNGTFEGPSLTKRSSTTNTRRQVRVDATRCDARSLFRSFVRYGQSEFVFRLID